jgi:hypothetical protein
MARYMGLHCNILVATDNFFGLTPLAILVDRKGISSRNVASQIQTSMSTGGSLTAGLRQ